MKNSKILEYQAKPGDIIEVANGNRYLVLPNRKQIYVGNKSVSRISDIDCNKERPNSECEVVGSLELEF